MSIQARDIPDVLPGFFKARLNGDTYYNDIVVLVIDEGDVESDILSKLATILGKNSKLGVAVFILPINEANDDPGSPSDGPLRLNIGFQVWEDRLKNKSSSGTGKSGYQVARHTFALFKSFTVGGVAKLLVPEKPAIEKVTAPDGNKKLKGWGLNFTAREDDNTVTPKVELPAFTPRSGAASTVAITCATAGAAIWYTTDGTPPTPTTADATSTAQLYNAPIVVPVGGFTLFAQAVKDDYFPSSMISTTFTPSP